MQSAHSQGILHRDLKPANFAPVEGDVWVPGLVGKCGDIFVMCSATTEGAEPDCHRLPRPPDSDTDAPPEPLRIEIRNYSSSLLSPVPCGRYKQPRPVLGCSRSDSLSVDLSASLAGLAGHKLFPSTTTGRTVFLHGSIPFRSHYPKPAPCAKICKHQTVRSLPPSVTRMRVHYAESAALHRTGLRITARI